MKKINQIGGLDIMVVIALAVVVVVGGLLFGKVWNSDSEDDGAAEIEIQDQDEPAVEAMKAEISEAQRLQDEQENAEPNISGELTLKAKRVDTGIDLSWIDSGVDATAGYKIVYSSSHTAPEYGVHNAQYANAGVKSTTVSLSDGLTYNFRICAYRPDSGTCDAYSDAVVESAPTYQEEKVVSGAMKIVQEGKNLSWTFTGTAPHGFKVVINKTGSPKYPVDSIQYVGAESRSTELPKETKGNYFVRVCKYTADASIKGGCTDYSNQLEYTVK